MATQEVAWNVPTWNDGANAAALRFHAEKAPDDRRNWIDLTPDEQGVYVEKAKADAS